MAQQQTDHRTDALSADVKALREQVDKLSDKLNDSQREVVVLRAELGGQDKRLSDTVSRIGDVNLWLAGFALIVALAGVFGFVQAVQRAKAEVKDWIEQNRKKLNAQINAVAAEAKKGLDAQAAKGLRDHIRAMEEEAAKLLSRLEQAAQKADHKAGQIEAIYNGMADKAKAYSEPEKAENLKAESEVKDKPENRLSAHDWNIRAFAAYEDGRLLEAVAYWEESAECLEATSAEIASALFNKGVVLGELGQLGEAIAAYDEVVIRFGASSELALREKVAEALGNKGVDLGTLGRLEEAIAAYDEVVDRFGASSELALREQVAGALFNKGVDLGALERWEEAVAVYNDMVVRFGESPEPALREQVGKALVNKGVRLGALGRSAEEIAVYDEVVVRFGASNEPALLEQVAKALVNKGVTLGQQGQLAGAISAYDDLIARFGASSEQALLEQVAKAMVNKGATLGQLGQSTEAIAVYNEVVIRFAASSGGALQEQVARALVNKGVRLGALGQAEEALAVCDEVIVRFGASQELVLREAVARALINKGLGLGQLRRLEEAIAIYEEVERRFVDASETELRTQLATAFGLRGRCDYGLGKDSAFLKSIQQALQREPNAGWLLCNRAFALYLTGRWHDEVMAAYTQAWQAIGDLEKWETLALADLHNHGHSVRPDAEPIPQELIDEVAALAEPE